ncbi:hypothetical protein B0T26DRAFT_700214 [Lasiosphaeria miniovina]|uniref:Zn(2)-C6 fungal-type domain-containing protein n=1 Tax=Lasiosphaeria miniovina TaxID=1954250 RepID=A0AA40ATJ5_9PEZI|nr:uncharacterized protein B0T26DRAFT_700214 [Lasiosphaeria miniovina]KAK0721756.1 hypothetical protein B0T26DRAFT_700214 [Lasiosphaeria miniovina]
MNRAAKRPYPFADEHSSMGRSKMPRVPNPSQDLSEEARRVLEHAASILNLPVANLLSASSRSANDGPQHLQQQPVLRAEPEHDACNQDPPSPPEDIGKADLDDTVEWHSSAAEFDGIDPNLAGVYFDLDCWVDGHSHVGAAPTATAESANGSRDQRQVPSGPWQPAQQRPMPPQPPSLSWELVETAVDPTALQTARNPSEWTMIQARPSHPQLPKSADTPAVEELQIISVNPNQSQPRPQRRKAFGDRERQEETGQTRGLKACVRCRMQKIRCAIDKENPNGICGTCQALSADNMKVHNLPCLRHRLTECTLYRTGKAPGLEFTFRWPVMKLKDTDNWAAPEVRTILVQSDVCPVPLQLAVRKFVPIPGKDSLTRAWMDHKKQTKKYLETTPYAIYDMQKAVQDMRDYVTTNVFPCMDYFLKGSDRWVKETYEFARKHMQRTDSDEERKLLGNFFRLWFAVRRTATMEHIVGDDTLDMTPEVEDQSCPLFKKVPLPPVMIQQLDMILTLGILQPLQKQVLEDYQKLVLANNPKNWMTVYLVAFMSLHSCAKISEENYNNARKHGLLRRYAIPNFIQERHHSANVFLSHYHYRTESANPFIQDWKRRHATPFSHTSVDEIHFLEQTKAMVRDREAVIKINRQTDLYEHELYFIAQMFEENWQPRDTIIDRTEGTVNNVGLKRYAGK